MTVVQLDVSPRVMKVFKIDFFDKQDPCNAVCRENIFFRITYLDKIFPMETSFGVTSTEVFEKVEIGKCHHRG